MSTYVFRGYPDFLESAAVELDRPESAGPSRRISSLTALANLCAQAAEGDTANVAGILAKATEFRDQIATALRAADLMLADVEAGLRPQMRIEAEPYQELLTNSETAPASRPGRKGSRTSRELS